VLEANWQPIGDSSSHGNLITFQGAEDDIESGLLYFGTRSLQPFLGRFVQRHPEGIALGTNVYDAARLVNGSMPDGR
jgi:RHS repeat-associated protein